MLPIGALFVAFFAVAVPVILLMTVWAGVMAFKLLFPEDALPPRVPSAKEKAVMGGAFRPVRVRDIVEDQDARREVAARERGLTEVNPLFEDLWLRRN